MLSWFLDVATWRTVRAYGALTVLTRASYLALVVVPLLAGVWPGVRMTIDKARDKLVHVADNVDRDAQRLLNQSKELDSLRENSASKPALPQAPGSNNERQLDDTAKAALKLTNDAEEMSKNLRRLASSLPHAMPTVLGYAFFAALAVALGQVSYQTFAPEIVRKFTLEEYQESESSSKGREPTSDEINHALRSIRRAEFNRGTFLNKMIVGSVIETLDCISVFEEQLNNAVGSELSTEGDAPVPTQSDMTNAAQSDEVQKAVQAARVALVKPGIFYAREILDMLLDPRLFLPLQSLIQPDLDKSSSLHDRMPRKFENAAYIVQHHLNPPFDFKDEAEKTAYNRERIWIGAKIEYLDQARLRARGMCLVSFSFYIIATELIAWITFTQAKSVAEAVGWLHVL